MEVSQGENRQNTGGAEGVGDSEPVLAGDGIVVVAKEEDPVGGGGNSVGGGFDEGEADVSGIKIDAEEITGNFGLGGKDHDACGMDVLL